MIAHSGNYDAGGTNMGSKWELKEKSTGELVATVEGETWKSAQKKAFNKIKRIINIPGFR